MDTISRKNKNLLIAVTLHFPIFVALHTIPFIIGHYLFPALSIEWLHFPIERWLIWVVPSAILIKVFEKDLYVSLKNMFFNKVKLKTFLWCILPLVVYLIGGLFITKYTGFSLGGSLRKFANINDFLSVFSEESYGCLVTPAIPEEMVFRAWIQNALLGKAPNRKRAILAIIISNIMFIIIHLPTYFYSYHYSLAQALLEGFGAVFILGSAFGIMFYKSKNILVPIFAHWLCDVIAFTFYV